MQQVKLKGGKKIRAAREKIVVDKLYNIPEAIEVLRSSSFVKFNETLEVALKLGVDPRHSDQMVRGVVSLPAGTGKTVRVAVICKEDKESIAKEAGADIVGSVNIIDDIKAGNINFDICIATPDMMAMIGQVAKILGPKGLMPNPKLGTVTPDIAKAVNNAKSGQVEYRVDKNGIIHAGVGKISFTTDDLKSNVKALISAIAKSRPSGAKGTYMRALYFSTTMGPSVKIDMSEVQ